MAPAFSKLVDTTLGLDIGSTSTRACLWIPSKKQAIHVENTVEKMSGALFRPGDYTSAGYPFEPQGPVYLDGDSDPNRRETSLKFGFYPLANVKDKDLLEQYHLVQPLMEKKDDPRFRARLRQGLVELLTAVDRDVQSNCRIKGLKITRIGLSIPAQWTLEFEDVYREIAMQVFGYIGGNIEANIFFHTETEALAHFLLHETPEHFQVRESEDYRVFLFLDFGGHNMNGCIFNLVQRDQNESPSFYRIGDAFGVGGGSEHWTFNIGKRVLHEMRNSPGMSLSLEEQRDMLESFNIKKGSLGPSRARANQPFKFGPCPVSMSLEDITECFEKGHKNVFEKAKGEIELVSEYKAVPQVIISGGTAKHTDVQIRLRGFCNAAGIPEPWFVSGSSMTYSSGKIAHGVAMAASNCLTIPEFMARGAAFGLQTRECANRGNTNPNNLWNDVGYFLLSQNRQVTLPFQTGGNDEYKIICDPFFESHPSKDLHFDRCYDIIDLGKSKAGSRSITLSLTSNNGLTSLVIKTTREWNGGHKRRLKGHHRQQDHNQIEEKESPPLPMYFDGGTNCAHVDLNEYDITGLDFGIKRDNKCLEEGVDSTNVQENADTPSHTHMEGGTESTNKSTEPLPSAISTGGIPVSASSLSQKSLVATTPQRIQQPQRREPLAVAPRQSLSAQRLTPSVPSGGFTTVNNTTTTATSTQRNVRLAPTPKYPAQGSNPRPTIPKNDRLPYVLGNSVVASPSSASASNKLPAPQKPKEPAFNSFISPLSRLSYPSIPSRDDVGNTATERSGRSKPIWERGKAPEINPRTGKVQLPCKNYKDYLKSMNDAGDQTPQMERKRKRQRELLSDSSGED